MAEQGIGLDIRHWRHRNDSAVWVARGVTAVLAILLVGVAIRSLIPDPWWMRAGFERDPGLFVRKHAVDYPVCAAWTGNAPFAAAPGWYVVEKSLPAIPASGRTVDIGILLPANAKVVAIYCGRQPVGAAPVECSMTAGCAANVTVALDDDVYTHGRALTLMVTGKGGAARDGEAFRFWLAWK